MPPIRITFIISAITEEDLNLLQKGYSIVSKMILSPDDHRLFHYKIGDEIQVETQHGLRLWCNIEDLEKVEDHERVILIFTLVKSDHTPTTR